MDKFIKINNKKMI